MERGFPLLEDPTYQMQTLDGFAPGSRAVHHVNAIRKRYSLYSQYVARELTLCESAASFPSGCLSRGIGSEVQTRSIPINHYS
jgi:hypothetical protein